MNHDGSLEAHQNVMFLNPSNRLVYEVDYSGRESHIGLLERGVVPGLKVPDEVVSDNCVDFAHVVLLLRVM